VAISKAKSVVGAKGYYRGRAMEVVAVVGMVVLLILLSRKSGGG
jgi:hypothetical protein